MNLAFLQKIEVILHSERLDAYRQDQADAAMTLARYSLNMALCESLYPVLQFAEIALRNATHAAFTARCGTDRWYDTITGLQSWQVDKIQEAKDSLIKNGKPITPGRMVAELSFGFWTGFFNKYHAHTGIGHYLASRVFTHAPKSERDLAKLDTRWKSIRDLRNRVFHHERILHWKDLDTQQKAMLEVIAWISPELHDLAATFDRFGALRKAGTQPWLSKLHRHWPAAAAAPPAAPSMQLVPAPQAATNGVETPFGHRWGGDVFRLTAEHLNAMHQGQSLALDVMNEYVVFLQFQPDELTRFQENPQP